MNLKIVSLNEGGTPFCKCDKLGDELGINLYVKKLKDQIRQEVLKTGE